MAANKTYHKMAATKRLLKYEAKQSRDKSLRQAETKIQNIKIQLIQMTKMAAMGEMLTGIIHEINNPLNAILGDLFLLKNYYNSGLIDQEVVKDACEAAEQLKKVVENCLTYSRENRDDLQSVDINKAVEGALVLLKYSLLKYDIMTEKDLSAGLRPVLGDLSRLEQVFTNLINNAIQAMPEGGTLKVISRYLPDSDQVEVSVSDTGHGIPAKDLPRIFEPFFSTKPSGQGTGLGLSISKNIIDKHQGKIAVASRPGQGTCFTLTFPVQRTTVIPIDRVRPQGSPQASQAVQ